ncbi:hypothetical protein HK099_007080 [Clydaea vesicula]|uniref:poly(ADP-ribose) glycohydrolase n=1 Tax=Clydaea vesicula TaxID=447962 RepID=A0AAD5Y0P4_9FUNG|nr:hypothetical protein HK099_007080 [Clydaea vesicula]
MEKWRKWGFQCEENSFKRLKKGSVLESQNDIKSADQYLSSSAQSINVDEKLLHFVLSPNKNEELFPSSAIPDLYFEKGNFVFLPFEEESKWKLIKHSISQRIETVEDLEEVFNSYNQKKVNFTGLNYYFNEHFSKTKNFFINILPKMQKSLLNLPVLFKDLKIPILKKNVNSCITLNKEQIFSLISNLFFCTISQNHNINLPSTLFKTLFESVERNGILNSKICGKMDCIMNYFERMAENLSEGNVTFQRRCIPEEKLPDWGNLDSFHLKNTDCRYLGTIEDDGFGCSQVDFANKNIGGGVLSRECLIVIGLERFSNYRGYGETFQFSSNFCDKSGKDALLRFKSEFVAIDALHFNNSKKSKMQQYEKDLIIRELNKAYIGFLKSEVTCFDESRLVDLATGNWGCGAFNGDKQLKFLIQYIAASACSRNLRFFTFGDEFFANKIINLIPFLKNVSLGKLFRIITSFHSDGEGDLFNYVNYKLKNQ